MPHLALDGWVRDSWSQNDVGVATTAKKKTMGSKREWRIALVATAYAVMVVGCDAFSSFPPSFLSTRPHVGHQQAASKLPSGWRNTTHPHHLTCQQMSVTGDKFNESDGPDFTAEEQKFIEELNAKGSDTEIRKVLLETLPSIPPDLVIKIRISSDHPNEAIRYIATELNDLLNDKMSEAKETLQSLLSSGEIRKLDSLVGQYQRGGKLDVAFFHVLAVNLKDAAESESKDATDEEASMDADDESDGVKPATRYQILQHIYTRCQEEVEKTIPPGSALLNKLLRTPEASIRSNLYRHYLAPVSKTITTPDGKKIDLTRQDSDKATKPPSLVSISDFVGAIAGSVQQVRTVEKAGGTDRESAAAMVESFRQISKEARMVVGDSYGIESDELRTFEDGLQPVFRPESPSSPYIQGESAGVAET